MGEDVGDTPHHQAPTPRVDHREATGLFACRTQHHRAMRTTGRAYGCGTAKRRYRHRLPSPLCASNNFLIRSSLLCEEADGWRCLAGWRLRCLRSCCARRPQTSQHIVRHRRLSAEPLVSQQLATLSAGNDKDFEPFWLRHELLRARLSRERSDSWPVSRDLSFPEFSERVVSRIYSVRLDQPSHRRRHRGSRQSSSWPYPTKGTRCGWPDPPAGLRGRPGEMH
jgi:hypothetical protein